MELILKNFRSYHSKTFTLPSKGLTLIQGKRGAGKSTILNALVFVLYGKIKKPFSHGFKTCSVELIDSDNLIHIIREKKPSNRLVVFYKDIKYEDDSAQGVINEYMGINASEFFVSSYFDQQKNCSLFSMNPSEQLKFVETIASFNKDNNLKKLKIKENIKNIEKERIEILSNIKLVNNQILKKEEELSKTNKPPDGYNISNIKEEYDKNNKNIKILKENLKIKKEELLRIAEQDKKKLQIEETKQKYECKLQILTEKRDAIPQILSEVEIGKLSDETQKIKKLIDDISNFNKAETLKKEYEKCSTEYFDEKSIEMREIESNIIPEKKLNELIQMSKDYEKNKKIFDEREREKIEEITKKKDNDNAIETIRKNIIETYNIRNLKPDIQIITKTIENKIKDLIITIDKLNDDIDLLKCKKTECPSCKIPLFIKENQVHILDTTKIHTASINDVSNKTLKDYEIDLENANKKLGIHKLQVEKLKICGIILSEIEKKSLNKTEGEDIRCISLEEFQSTSIKISTQKDIISKYNSLKKEICEKKLPEYIIRIDNKYKEASTGLPKNIISLASQNIQELKDKASVIDKKIIKAWSDRGEYNNLTRDINSLEENIKALSGKKYLGNNISNNARDIIVNEIENLQEKLDKCLEKFMENKNQLDLLEMYLKYDNAISEIQKLSILQKEYSDKLTSINDRLKGADGLEAMSREAELLSLEKVIESINEHVNVYLDTLFEGELIAEMRIKRNTKKGVCAVNPSIQIHIEYKGDDLYDDIDELSGGEKQQIDLGFILGLNDLLGGKMLLLDECFNHLDGDTNNDTVNLVKDLCVDKKVLIVSHEAIHGNFDNIINV